MEQSDQAFMPKRKEILRFGEEYLLLLIDMYSNTNINELDRRERMAKAESLLEVTGGMVNNTAPFTLTQKWHDMSVEEKEQLLLSITGL